MSLMFNLVKTDDSQFLNVFVSGREPLSAGSTHPNFKAILAAVLADAEGERIDVQELVDLFDIAATVTRKFERLSKRVTIVDNELLFDGDPAQPGLSKQIIRFLDESLDVAPLVSFMEKIENNPSEHSKSQAWAWLDNHDFTITEDGDVIAYKGVENDGNGGYQSISTGTAYVDDVKHVGKIPNAVGSTVTMPRSEVMDDPHAACRAGLHVGTFSYASSWGTHGAMLKVLIDPRDIVSVPHDAKGAKIRVCRYTVLDIIEGEVTSALDTSVPCADVDESLDVVFEVGDLIQDEDGDSGVVTKAPDEDGFMEVDYSDNDSEDEYGDSFTGSTFVEASTSTMLRKHGVGGPTSYAAKGNGRNPAQDTLGRFSAGRPGSARDAKTGRFAG